MEFISLELILQALKYEGLEETFEALERLFYDEFLICITVIHNGHVLRFFNTDELYEYLEYLKEKVVVYMEDDEEDM